MKAKHLCKNSYCRGTRAPGRTICYKCRSRKITEDKPIDMCFYWLRQSAKKRNLAFTLELKWFRKWVMKSDYMEKRGRGKNCLNIDRIDNLRGYHADNIQLLTKTDNVCKFHAEDLRRQLGVQYEGEMPF